MKLYVVRHGETNYNRQRRMQGYQEIPLNDRGIAQAAQLAQRLAGEQLDHIVCSDLRRAVMTGCIVAARTGSPMSYDAGLRERDPGDLVEHSYDDEPRFFTDPDYVPQNGEGVPAFRERVRTTFNGIAAAHESTCPTLLVVAHGLVCHAFVDEFFGSQFSEGVGAGNATLTIAHYDRGAWSLESATCAAHLAGNFEVAGAPGA